MRLVHRILFVAILGFAVAGCSNHDNPVSGDRPSATTGIKATASIPASINLSGYLVEFDNRVVAGGQTTFFYTVSGADAVNALSHFFLELPSCAPDADAFDPANPTVNVSPFTNIYGATWNIGLETDESRGYSVTFPGDVPLGLTRTHVKAGTTLEVGVVAGPCAGFIISGIVYVDADSSGAQTAEELGIDDVTVRLDDGNGGVESVMTGSDGSFSFLKAAGTYTVHVDAITPENDFNETLFAAFDSTGTNSLAVTVGPDSPGNDFGYYPKTEEIIADLELGVLTTDGEDFKYWVKQVRQKGRVDYSGTDIDGFITEIEGLFLTGSGVPFEFLSADKTDDVLAIMTTKSKDNLELLKKELLVGEFNHIAGLGLADPSLQAALLKWVEAIVVEASAAPPALSLQAKGGDTPLLAGGGGSDVDDALGMMILLNGATGTGGGGGTSK